jgi:hypothetical protein
MNSYTLENKRRLFEQKIDALDREAEHRRVCRQEGQRLMRRTTPPRWWQGTPEKWAECVYANFNDVL